MQTSVSGNVCQFPRSSPRQSPKYPCPNWQAFLKDRVSLRRLIEYFLEIQVLEVTPKIGRTCASGHECSDDGTARRPSHSTKPYSCSLCSGKRSGMGCRSDTSSFKDPPAMEKVISLRSSAHASLANLREQSVCSWQKFRRAIFGYRGVNFLGRLALFANVLHEIANSLGRLKAQFRRKDYGPRGLNLGLSDYVCHKI